MAEELTVTEEIKNPESFNLGEFITGKVKYPTRDASVVLDRDTIYRARQIADEIADTDEAKRDAALEALAPDPAFDEKLAQLKEQLQAVLDEAKASTLTFTMRGVAPKVWRIADKKLRMNHKAKQGATEEEKIELDIAFRSAINIEIVWAATVEVTDPNGNKVKPSKEEITSLADNLDEHEWVKLVDMANSLTFEIANLDDAIGSDADFLSMS